LCCEYRQQTSAEVPGNDDSFAVPAETNRIKYPCMEKAAG